MKTDNKIREGFHSIEILLNNYPEVSRIVIYSRDEVKQWELKLKGELEMKLSKNIG